MTKFECTNKVESLRYCKKDADIAKIIGISKPTLYTRLKRNNWKVSEIYLIEKFRL